MAKVDPNIKMQIPAMSNLYKIVLTLLENGKKVWKIVEKERHKNADKQ